VADTPETSSIADESSDEQARTDKDIHAEALARFKLCADAENEHRLKAIQILEFIAGNQWDEKAKAQRIEEGRPCLVINKIPQFINQITNDQRQNRPAIKVHPVDDKGDIETAKIHQGLVRHIEYNSNAEAAYDTSFEYAVKIGRGFYRVITEYASPISFEQEILIKRIPNPLSVSFDPFSVEVDGSDANFAFVSETISADEFKSRYPKSELALSEDWAQFGDDAAGWISAKDGVRIAEYFYKKMKPDTVCQLSNGETVLKSELPEVLADDAGQPLSIINERETQVPEVCWVKLNGTEILEKTIWPGKYIPIIPTYGTESNINGKRTFKGVVEDAMDPARMYNVWTSAATEAIGLAPKAPYIAPVGSTKGFEHQWESANRKSHAVLYYNASGPGGTLIPPPQRQAFEPAVQAITQAAMLASDDIKAVTGIYDASLGNKSNETSGVAIQRRNVQAQTSNFHFIDNLTRSLRHTGRILIDLIPKVYDTARTARIIGDDGEQKVVRVNDPNLAEGQDKPFMLDAGRYDVTVDVGPSFQTKRQEAAASMLELSKSAPQMMQIAPDLITKNLDFPGAAELSERFKKTVDPRLLDDGKQQNEIPPQAKAQMDQMGQMLDQLNKQLNELQTERETKRVELESKERIAMAQIQADIEINLAKLGSQEAVELLRQEIGQIEARMNLLNQQVPISFEQDSMAPAGDPVAMGGGPIENPTGGESPGQPLEGNPNEPIQY
jgi:hypothetical protein